MQPQDSPTLLVADDNPELRRLVRDAVGASFADVIEVTDGRGLFWRLVQACYAADAPPRLVVVADVRMPVYDGLEVLEAWKSLECPIPVVIVTAFADHEVRERAEKLGARLLTKPFSLGELRHALDEAGSRP